MGAFFIALLLIPLMKYACSDTIRVIETLVSLRFDLPKVTCLHDASIDLPPS
jgi:hypothetical protein